MSDSVDITDWDRNGLLMLQWFSDGEEGAILGESLYREKDFEKSAAESSGDRWFIAATLAVTAMNPKRDSNGFYFEERVLAEAALRVAKAARHRTGPMPAWAIKAQAAGWKAPKGWRP